MQEIIWILIVVIVTTLIYKIIPYRQWKSGKPKLVLFPRYVAQYSSQTEDLITNIKEMGFESRSRNSNSFMRGKAYGDFSAKWMKLEIRIDEREKEIKVFAPLFGIIFDNGDLWKIVSNTLSNTK